MFFFSKDVKTRFVVSLEWVEFSLFKLSVYHVTYLAHDLITNCSFTLVTKLVSILTSRCTLLLHD